MLTKKNESVLEWEDEAAAKPSSLQVLQMQPQVLQMSPP
jgi:hypothetical protein